MAATRTISHKVINHGLISPVDCPLCHASAATRSHRKHFLEFFRTKLTGKVPFRCSNCKVRFWQLVDPRDL